jgi:hypothetical protein
MRYRQNILRKSIAFHSGVYYNAHSKMNELIISKNKKNDQINEEWSPGGASRPVAKYEGGYAHEKNPRFAC